MVHRPFLALLLATALAGLSCGEIPEPEGFTVAEPSTTPGVEGLAVEEPAGITSGEAPPLLPSEFVPQAPDGYVPEVLVAAENAVLVSEAGTAVRLPPPIGTRGATRVVDDLLGGVVMQETTAGDPGEGSDESARAGDVIWLPAEGVEPSVIEDDGSRLLDVGYVGGSPSAVVLRPSQEIERIRLVDGVTAPLLTLGADEELLSLSASGSLHAVVLANAQCGDLRFYSADGERLGIPGPGEPDCIVPRRAAYGTAALSPDGGAVAYTVVSYRNDGIEVATELVVRDLESGIDYVRRKIGEDGDRISALGFDGERVVYLRRSPDGPTVTLLEVTGEQQEIQLELPSVTDVRSVSFARLSLAGG